MDLPVQLVTMEPANAAFLPAKTDWLARWHLLSLDAPTVTVTWTCFVARIAHVTLAPTILLAMFLAVWIVYAADRLLDGVTLAGNCEARHRFHHRHRRRFTIALAVATALLIPLTIVIPWLDLKLYLGLAGLLLLWFGVVHLPGASALKLPKELLPGVFCAAAAFIPVWRERLALAALLYCTLITLNCWSIYKWEHEGTADAHVTTRIGVRWLRELDLVTIAISFFALAFEDSSLAPIFLAVAVSASLLLALDRLRTRLKPTQLRAAADLVLLTPLFLLPILR